MSALSVRPAKTAASTAERRAARHVVEVARPVVVLPGPGARETALYQELCRLNPRTRIILPASPRISEWPDPSFLLPISTRGSSFTRQWMLGLGQVIRSLEPDVVHVHFEPWAMTTLRAIATDVPVVIHAAESLLREAPLALRLRRTGTRHALTRCAGYINWGVTGLAAASEAGLPATTPRAILPAAPPNPEVFTRQPMRQPDGTLRVVYVGRLAPEKGVETLLRAAADPQRRHLLQVTIVGGGPLMRELCEMAKALGTPAEFRGVLDPAATHESIATADVLVAPSQDTAVVSEQWGRSVVEAMMTGRSVLTSDAGELPHLVEDRRWTFPQGDWVALGRALDALIAEPSLVATRAEEAYARSTQYRPAVVAQRIYDFWGEALTTSTGRSRG